MKTITCLFIALLLFAKVVLAQIPVLPKLPIIELPSCDTSLTVWHQAELLEDLTGRLSIQQAIALQPPLAFSSTAGYNPQLGFSAADYWLRFRVRTADTISDQTWVLHILYSFANQLTLFLVDETSGLVEERHSGEGTPMRAWDMPYQEGAFLLKLLPDRTYTVFLRQSGNNSKSFITAISERQQYHNFMQLGTYWLALYNGMLLFAIVVQLIFFGFTKERNFILYALYILAVAFVIVQSGNGLPGEVYFWPENDWMNRNGMVLSTAFFTAFGLTFYANGLKLRTYSRSLFWLLCGFGFLVLPLTVLVLLDVVAINATQYVMGTGLFFLILTLLSSIVSMTKGFKPARYYLLATLSFLIGVITLALWHQGVVPINFLTTYCIPIGNISEVIFFTLALADDYRRTQRQERDAQQQLIETLQTKNQQISSALLQGQTLERQRVAADLHDNLGSTLTSLQWSLEAIDKTKLTKPEQDVYTTLSQQVSQAHNDIRLLSHNLLPNELAKQGPSVAMKTLIDKLNRNTPVRFTLTGADTLSRLDAQTEFELYSICLELLNNIVKHAQATEGQISISLDNNLLSLRIADNGVGLNDQRQDGRGLHNIAARVDTIGGTWSVNSVPAQGVENRIVVPVRIPARVSSQT